MSDNTRIQQRVFERYSGSDGVPSAPAAPANSIHTRLNTPYQPAVSQSMAKDPTFYVALARAALSELDAEVPSPGDTVEHDPLSINQQVRNILEDLPVALINIS